MNPPRRGLVSLAFLLPQICLCEITRRRYARFDFAAYPEHLEEPIASMQWVEKALLSLRDIP